MSVFTNLKLAARLGIAFGALVVALAITTALSLNGLGQIDADTDELSHRDVGALLQLVTISEDFLASDGDIVRHLYVEDGDLKAQDARAEKIEAWRAEADEALPALADKLESDAAKATLADFQAAYEKFVSAGDKAIELSRQETVDAVEDRVGSREVYLGEVLPALEGLDVIHDELEDAVAGQAAASAAQGDATAARVTRTVLIVTLVGLLIALALAFVIVRSVTRPVAALGTRLRSLNEHCLENLSNGLRAVAHGDLTVAVAPVTSPLDVRSTDEIGQLSSTFNDMLGKAQSSIESYNEMRGQLGSLIGQVSNSAGTVASASQEMASTSEEAGRAVGEIAGAVGEVAQGAERQVRMVETDA